MRLLLEEVMNVSDIQHEVQEPGLPSLVSEKAVLCCRSADLETISIGVVLFSQKRRGDGRNGVG